jgi:hypothetical protein
MKRLLKRYCFSIFDCRYLIKMLSNIYIYILIESKYKNIIILFIIKYNDSFLSIKLKIYFIMLYYY